MKRSKIAFTVGLLSTMVLLFFSFKSCKEQSKETTYCGEVVGKTSEYTVAKHRQHRHDKIFLKINDGQILTIDPDSYTYFKAEKGMRMCFTLSKRQYLQARNQSVYLAEVWFSLSAVICLLITLGFLNLHLD